MMMMLVRAIRTRRHSSYPCWSQQLPYRLSKTPAEASAWHRTLTQLLHMKISYNSHLWLTPWDNTPGLMWNLTVLILPRNNSSWILYLPLDNLIRLCSWELPEQWQREGRKAPERVLQGSLGRDGFACSEVQLTCIVVPRTDIRPCICYLHKQPLSSPPSSLLASGHLWNCRVGVTATGTTGEELGLQSVRPVRCKAGRTDPDPNSRKSAGTGGFSKYQRAVWFSYRKSDLEKCKVLSLPAVFILPPRRRFSSTRTSGLTHVPSAGITSKQ